MTMHYTISRRKFTTQLIASPALIGAAQLVGPFSTRARAQSNTLVTINVRSQSPSPQNFFFFQQPAIYTGGEDVYSNSLYNGSLPAFGSGQGAQLTFLNSLQYFAGVQTSNTSAPPVGQVSGYNSAWVATGLQASGMSNPCSTKFTQSNGTQLSLSLPVVDPAVQLGAFRVAIPTFNPNTYNFNVGSATLNEMTGSVVLSNFVLANPTTFQDCQPVLIYYVQTGAYTPGTVMNFSQSSQSAAVCDATNGKYNFNVTYKADGTWAVI